MSDNLGRQLYGQYTLPRSADLLATARNLRFGGSSVSLTPASNAVTLNAALGRVFSFPVDDDVTVTLTNMVEGHTVFLVIIASGSDAGVSFTGSGGNLGADPPTVSDGHGSLYKITKVGSGFYAVAYALGLAS